MMSRVVRPIYEKVCLNETSLHGGRLGFTSSIELVARNSNVLQDFRRYVQQCVNGKWQLDLKLCSAARPLLYSFKWRQCPFKFSTVCLIASK